MALRWIEGFETDQDVVDFGRKYAVAVNSGSWSFSTGPKVGSMMQAGGNADSELRTKTLVITPSNTWFTGWRVRCSTTSGGFTTVTDRGGGITAFRGASDQVEIRIHSAGGGAFTWRVYRGATLLGESPSFWDSDWIYWEFKFVCRTGTNGSVEIKSRDTYHGSASTVFYSLAAVNTANSGTDGADTFRFKFQFGNNGSFDDIYINDDSGSVNNDYTSGDVVIFGSSPNGDGNRVQWTPSSGTVHFSLVNDPAGTPSDTTKIKSQTPGQVDLFDYQNLALVSSGQSLLGLMMGTTGGMETSGSRNLRHIIRDTGGSEATGTAWNWSTTPTQHQAEVFEQNPVTSVPWTKTAVDAAQFGIELVS